MLEWVAIFFSRWSSQSRNQTCISCAGISSVQFSHSIMSDSLRPHGLQHTRDPCPSPTPKVYSNSFPLSRWCHATILSSVVPFSSHFQSFPASGSFQMSQFFALGGQSIRVSASASVLPMNIQDWFPLGLIVLIVWLIVLIELIKCREHFINLFGKVDNLKYLWI